MKGLILKVDIAKAYDTLSWSYLVTIMRSMGFGQQWIKWIMACLQSAHSPVLINGSPTMEFPIERGLCQEDPMAPFLFILAMEGLHVAFEEAIVVGHVRGLNFGQITLSHLMYADDVIFLGPWLEENLRNVLSLFHCFYLASGLKISAAKSKIIGTGVTMAEVDNLANLVSCKGEKIPFMYLGIPVGENMTRISAWKPILEKFDKYNVNQIIFPTDLSVNNSD